jgi:hypothetical protein
VVRLNAIIGTTGHVEKLRLSGHPILVQAAMKAATQYVYEITEVNRAPVKVVTTIDIRFVLK